MKKYKNRKWLYNRYIKQKKSMQKIADEIGCCQVTIFKWLKKFKIPTRKNYQKGAKNPHWKGGKTTMGGYIYISKPKHHRALKRGYVAEHILIAEKKIGRKIKDSEKVHHIDGNKTNNIPQNLYVAESHSEHTKIHKQLEKIGYELYKKGIILFDEINKCYHLNTKKFQLYEP